MQMPKPSARERFARMREHLGDSILTALTILLAVLMFVVAPLHAAGILQTQGLGFALVLLLIAGLFIVSGDAVAIAVIVVAMALTMTAGVLRLHQPSMLDVYLDATAWVLVTPALMWVIARAVFAPGRITYHRIMGAILLYLTIGLTFAALQIFVGLAFPEAFLGIRPADEPTLASNFIYFSFVTLTSTGFGDIVPVHPLARSLCNVEAIIGQLYPATLLARLITLELEGRHD